jgi:hypothetical protein
MVANLINKGWDFELVPNDNMTDEQFNDLIHLITCGDNCEC